MKKSNDLKVFISNQDSLCDECGEELGRRAWITLEEGKGALCLACADLDHLVFLPSGDTALTRRSRKYSGRVGRTADAKNLGAEAVRLAVIAHVRHTETTYDDLLGGGHERWEARDQVRDEVEQILDRWENLETDDHGYG